MGDQLLGVFLFDRQHAGDEVDHLQRVGFVLVEEVEPLVDVFDFQDFVVRVVLQNELLEVVEGFFVLNVLANLRFKLIWVPGSRSPKCEG